MTNHNSLKHMKNVKYLEKNGVDYIEANNLSKHSMVKHAFTTRKGGVSSGVLATMNLGKKVNDSLENVMTNYKRLGEAVGVDYQNMVIADQIHDDKVKVVTKEDCGKGVMRDSDVIGYDALVTKDRGVPLLVFYADCVPVLFCDPKQNVIGAAHSGWKGTVKEISTKVVQEMESLGARKSDIEVAIGPSIGDCCFEVGEEVYLEFEKKFGLNGRFCQRKGEKWYIDMQGLIKASLVSYGLKDEKVLISSICTKCYKETFFSHRGDNGNTGRLGAMIAMDSEGN